MARGGLAGAPLMLLPPPPLLLPSDSSESMTTPACRLLRRSALCCPRRRSVCCCWYPGWRNRIGGATSAAPAWARARAASLYAELRAALPPLDAALASERARGRTGGEGPAPLARGFCGGVRTCRAAPVRRDAVVVPGLRCAWAPACDDHRAVHLGAHQRMPLCRVHVLRRHHHASVDLGTRDDLVLGLAVAAAGLTDRRSWGPWPPALCASSELRNHGVVHATARADDRRRGRVRPTCVLACQGGRAVA
eukprot:354192-Chlamydomonas_euryale.AAC.7